MGMMNISPVGGSLLAGANTWTGQNIFSQGTLTADAPFTVTQTWNNAGVTFTGFKVNITDTASASASLLMDLQVGGNSVLSLRKDSRLLVGSAGSTGGGIVMESANRLGILAGTSQVVSVRSGGIVQSSTGTLCWTSGVVGGTEDLILLRDAANTLAQRNSTNAQTKNLYDTYASSTDYHRVALKTARATLSSVSGASVTATNLIPDGAVVVGVTTKVTVALGTGGGTTGYTIGDGSDADRWGDITGTAAGTSSDNRDWTATTVQAFIAANNVVITAKGGNFNGTGTIYVSVQYLIGECD